MKEKNHLFSATGIPSLFLIFGVLMLVILSLLGYGTSRQDLRSSSLSLEQTSAYYNACSEAADFYSDLVQTLEGFQAQVKSESSYYKLVSDYLNSQENVKWDSEEHTAEYMNAFSDTQSLAVKVSVFWTDRTADSTASDIFIIAGRPLSVKIDGKLCTLDGFEERLMPPETDEFIRIIYKLAHDRNIEPMLETGDDDFSMAIPGLSRFRVNTYRQRGSLAAVIRIIAFDLPDPQDLHIPPAVMEAADLTKGMVLITGPAGSGKSTTMACIIDKINHSREGHIITLEDPLEYLHRHDKCIVSQREICTDTANYLVSLRATLRQSPDVILLGEMRDHETIQTAMTAAETGHLILSSLHTTGAANTISRIMDVFEPSQQHQIAIQLSMVLQTVISQQLVPDVNGHNIPVFEIMRLTPAIRNMIRDNKIYQIDGVIASSSQADMKSMDNSLLELYRNRQITKETALKYSSNPEMLKRKLL